MYFVCCVIMALFCLTAYQIGVSAGKQDAAREMRIKR